MFGPRLGLVWALFGPCLGLVWVLFGPCFVWASFRFMSSIWNCIREFVGVTISPVELLAARSPGYLAGGTSAGEISWGSRRWDFGWRDLLGVSPVGLLPARSPGDLAGGNSAGEISWRSRRWDFCEIPWRSCQWNFCRRDLLGISPVGLLPARSPGPASAGEISWGSRRPCEFRVISWQLQVDKLCGKTWPRVGCLVPLRGNRSFSFVLCSFPVACSFASLPARCAARSSGVGDVANGGKGGAVTSLVGVASARAFGRGGRGHRFGCAVACVKWARLRANRPTHICI